MSLILTQTDAAADCGAMSACSGGSLALETGTSELAEGASGGTTEQTIKIDSDSTSIAFFCQTSGGVGETTWESGDYTVRLNVTTGSSFGMYWEAVYICRVDSNCSSVATVGSNTSISKGVYQGGTFSATVSGSSQSAASTDDLYIIYEFDVGSGPVSIGVTPDQDIDTPIVTLSPPSNVQITDDSTEDELTLDWDEVSDAAGYYVYRAEQSFSDPSEATQVADVASPPYTDTGLEDGEKKYYRVSSHD